MIEQLVNFGRQTSYLIWALALRRDMLRPTYAIDKFNDLKVPDHTKVIILDKDNCFAKPHTNEVWSSFQKCWRELLAHDGKKYDVFVLSNTAGDLSHDPNGILARTLEASTGARVLRHAQKKPMCYAELPELVSTNPRDILVVGDRLATDVLLANLIGAQSTWIRPGVHPGRLNGTEMFLYKHIIS